MQVNFEDKKSSLKFLNSYLILFSLVIISLSSFFARLKYYNREFIDTLGFTTGDIVIVGVLLIQFAMQIIYTRKQLKN